MTTSVQFHSDGSMTSKESNGKGYASSADYQANGIEARSGMGSRTVADHTRIADNEIIQIDGMEITAGMARDMGLIGGHKDDGGLSVGNVVAAAQSEPEPVSTTGHEGYDAVAQQLHTQAEEGKITASEAMEYDTVHAQLALADITPDQITETISAIADGSIDPSQDLDADQRALVANTERQVTKAATESAMAALGQKAFDDLQAMARVSPEVNSAIQGYATQRAMGVADVTWSQFYRDVQDHLAGR